MTKTQVSAGVVVLCAIATLATSGIGHAQVVAKQEVDKNGAPQYRVDPFWPKPLPNKWSMQQVVGIWVDHMDHVWFLNRGVAALPIELVAEGNPSPALCCVRGPELIEVDQQGNVVNAWGGPKFHPKWPATLQTVVVDSKGFVWISGEANEDSILKFTRDGKLVWDFDHRPPPEQAKMPETNQETSYLLNKGRFQLDEVANEMYIINQKRVLVYDMTTGAYKRGWGGHGMPLSEVTNGPIAGYKWTGGPPPEEKNFVPNLHFVEISKDRKVYIGERGQNRIQVFTTEGKWLQDIYVSPNSPAQRGGCGGLDAVINAPNMAVPMTFYQVDLRHHVQDGDVEGPAAEVSLRRRRAQRRHLDCRAAKRQDARVLWRQWPSGRSDDLSELNRGRYTRQRLRGRSRYGKTDPEVCAGPHRRPLDECNRCEMRRCGGACLGAMLSGVASRSRM